MKHLIYILLGCWTVGCASMSDVERWHERTVRKCDVIVLCHRSASGPIQEITVREVWRSSDHPDWAYKVGDVLPPETYGGPWSSEDPWAPLPRDEIAFLTIMRRHLVTDCGYTEHEASEVVPKEMPVFSWYSMAFHESELDNLRRKYKNALPNKSKEAIASSAAEPAQPH